jgi:hypothetical protein
LPKDRQERAGRKAFMQGYRKGLRFSAGKSASEFGMTAFCAHYGKAKATEGAQDIPCRKLPELPAHIAAGSS